MEEKERIERGGGDEKSKKKLIDLSILSSAIKKILRKLLYCYKV